jgi:SAM-dependent methyltransferase
MGELAAQVDRWKFAPYVHDSDAVVDFGCGIGALLAALPGVRKIGIEVNEAASAEARRRGIEIVQRASDLEDAIADVVISNHALEHVLAPYHELCELHRLLKPRGALVLWLPLDDWRAQRKVQHDLDHHLYGWTPLLLRNLLLEAGFDVQVVRVVTRAWPPKPQIFARVPAFVFDAVGIAWSLLRRRRQLMALAAAR